MSPISRRRRGANAVEFAALLQVFLWAASGAVDYGWFFLVRADAEAAVRAAAQTGALAADPVAAAKASLADHFRANEYETTVRVTSAGSGAAPDLRLTVTAVVSVHPVLGLAPFPGSISAEAVHYLRAP